MTQYVKKYVEKIDDEIEDLIEADGLTAQRESDLHLLFENREHLLEWLCATGRDHLLPGEYYAHKTHPPVKAAKPGDAGAAK